MRRLPKKVRVMAFDYALKVVSEDIKNDQGQQLLGRIDYSNSEIELDKRQSPQSLLHTLWHECFHAIFCQLGLAQDEGNIDSLSAAVISVLRDNPYLRGEE